MRRSLRTRVLALLLFLLAQSILSTVSVARLAHQYRDATGRFHDALALDRLVHALETRIHAAAMAANDQLIVGAPPGQEARFRAADAEARTLLRALARELPGDGRESTRLGELDETYSSIVRIAEEIFARGDARGDPDAGARMERLDRTVDRATAGLAELLGEVERQVDAANRAAAERARRLRTTAFWSLAGSVGVSVVVLYLVNAWILRPLAEMRAAIASMQLGRYPESTPARSGGAPRRRPDELEEVSERLRAKFVEIGRLAELTRAINEGLSLDEVLELVYEKFEGIVPYDRIGLALVEEGGETIRSRWSRTRSGVKVVPDGYQASLDATSLARVLADGRPRILNDLVDYLAKKPSSHATALLVREGMRSSLTCPLLLKGAPIGVMFFSSSTTNAYRDAHVDLFLQISGQLAAIVEKSRLHDELVRLNRLKNDFLGMAAHDLRNPVAAIGGYAEIVLHDEASNGSAPERKRMLRRIGALAGEVNELLESLLDVAVIEAGSFPIAAEPVALAGFLRDVGERNRPVAESKGTTLVVDEAHDEVVRFDPLRVQQVLGNLIGNAVKFSPAGSRVEVGVRVDGGSVAFSVHDQGPGIPPEEQTRLFESFPRTSARPTGGERSTGLGLAICRKIVEAHGGTIGVESRPGSGATFRFELPRAA